ncbi:hypothetical protein SAMN05216391_102140 [Lachnospiraceae bacterium KHCPX20]|nr:hypothetical protein SAMN05216391_102140 [Lachnospiraceae bacterium KHCPX20]
MIMDKIYRRPTQLGGTPKKKKNEKNRKRNTIMNFRVSLEEKELIDVRIALSGLPKSEFFIESCLYQTILVKGNIRSFTEIKNRMEEIAGVIDKNPHLEDLEPEQAETIKTILEIIDKRFGKDE